MTIKLPTIIIEKDKYHTYLFAFWVSKREIFLRISKLIIRIR